MLLDVVNATTFLTGDVGSITVISCCGSRDIRVTEGAEKSTIGSFSILRSFFKSKPGREIILGLAVVPSNSGVFEKNRFGNEAEERLCIHKPLGLINISTNKLGMNLNTISLGSDYCDFTNKGSTNVSEDNVKISCVCHFFFLLCLCHVI